MILETERLLLKPYEIEFAEEIYQVVKHKEIADTMVMIPHPYPREVVDSWISYLQIFRTGKPLPLGLDESEVR